MQRFQLPACAVVFSLILFIVFFSKKRVELLENKIYSIMLAMVLFDSLLVTIVLSTGYAFGDLYIEIMIDSV